MRVLLDEQLPRQLVPYLLGHEVRTVKQERWTGLKNGELIRKAESAGFDVFLTGDRSLPFQQNLKDSRLFVVVLAALSNALEDLLPLIPAVLSYHKRSQARSSSSTRRLNFFWKESRTVALSEALKSLQTTTQR